MGWLSHQGFQVPHCHIYGDLKAVYDFYENTKKTRNDIEYEIDGIVISVNDLHKLEELGELSMRPKGQIAWKFDPAMGVTTMLDVKWQVGNSGNGRITPVASITPVNIGGVTITSVSLHNLALFRDLRLFKGCRVLISRRNDCIPYVEKNLSIEDA
jgi:DNA ligase (NAD+)